MKTDSQLQQDVIAELKWEPSVHATQIGVEVKDGIVTLSGHVTSFLEKYNAERATLRVSGVKALAVDMDVKLPALGQRDDSDIARSVENALSWMPPISERDITVMVENGWVTLGGAVDWQFQRLDAERAVRYLLGVTGVSNQIGIKAAITQLEVKQGIEAALARRAKVDANQITVGIDGTTVVLSGSVASWAEREAAREAAWGAPGVMRVDDRMKVMA